MMPGLRYILRRLTLRLARLLDDLTSPWQSCARCGRVERVVWVVDDRSWKTVVPQRWRNAVLCIDCFIRLAEQQGVPQGQIRWILFNPIVLTDRDDGDDPV